MNKPEIPGAPSIYPHGKARRSSDPQYPLQCIGPHYKRRTHSTWDETPWMEEADPQADVDQPPGRGARGIEDGDRVKVFNDRGAL